MGCAHLAYNSPHVYVDPNMHTNSICKWGLHMQIKFMFRVSEQYLFAYGNLHVGICTQEICTRGSPCAKLSKKHILDHLCLHMDMYAPHLFKMGYRLSGACLSS
jgi:hypothetical protein